MAIENRTEAEKAFADMMVRGLRCRTLEEARALRPEMKALYEKYGTNPLFHDCAMPSFLNTPQDEIQTEPETGSQAE